MSNSSCESSEDSDRSCALQGSGASDFVQKGLENSLYLEAQEAERELFAIGAALASLIFFFSLGYGARLLSPIMGNPNAWRFIDSGIALLRFSIATVIAAPFL